MHRFRKRSETGQNGQGPSASPQQNSSTSEAEVIEQEEDAQFDLPSDFRTSLILPDLSRRFTLLRSTTGEPLGLDTLRQKLAQQRERGAENQVTEEEEEMILNSFRFRSKTSNTPPQQSTDKLGPVTEDGSLRQSIQSTTTADSSQTSLYPSSITSSPTPSVRKSSKRYSNNLFGSGRLRDYSYLKGSSKNGGSRTQSIQSLTPSESSNQATLSSVTDSVRALTPENPSTSTSVEASPSPPNQTPAVQVSSSQGEDSDHVVSVAEYRISKTIGAAALKRASLALQQAIQEIEEADDEILLPRSTPIPRTSLEQRAATPEKRNPTISNASDYDAPMAISPEKHSQGTELTDRRASPVSSRILPGYVPGMPRPMTPRDLDPEDLRSHSTTPRATSPTSATFADPSGPSLPTSSPNRARSGSTASQHAYKSTSSPLFLQRSTNGRFTPEDGRRPASPLSGTAYQPMSVNSRPSTPSNITWTVPPISRSLRGQGHSRNNSVASDGGGGVAIESHGRHTPGARSLRSPALPDSPMIDRMDSELSNSSTASSTTREDSYYRPESKVSLMELGSPMRAQRSPTPTQSAPRSPTAANFSRSASDRPAVQATTPSTLFNLAPVSPSIFSPLSNPSRTSLESEGSSYHSAGEDEKDRSYRLISDIAEPKPVWHDLPKNDLHFSNSDDSTDDEWDPEEYVARYAGLKRSDFIAIQDKLVTAFKDRVERAPSAMRRRRPSTSQSNYSTKDLQTLQNAGPPPPQLQTPSSSISPIPAITTTAPEVTSSPDQNDYPPASPGTLRNRELAKALFGGHSSGSQEALSQLVPPSPADMESIPVNGQSDPKPTEETASSAVYENPAHNGSAPKVAQNEEEARLAQVQQRMQAATMALKSPTNPSPSPLQSSGTISKKRIDPNLISNPRLVSASTSVDAVPIQRSPSLSSAQASGTSKIGSRFKKLRGTLRAKNSPAAEDSGSYSPESRSASQAAHYDHDAPSSASSLKPSVTTPPASAGPGLKGFMARLRGKQRSTSDQSVASESRLSPQPPRQTHSAGAASSLSQRVPSQRVPKTPTSANTEADIYLPVPRSVTPQIQSAPPFQTSYPLPAQGSESADPLKQLWEAAEKIGIEPGELNALLARSNSTASRLPTRSDSLAVRRAQTPVDANQLTPTVDQQTFRSETPDHRSNGNGTGTDSDATARAEKRSSRQGSRRVPENLRVPREGTGNNAASAVIRRTIIFPDSKMTPDELAALMGKSPIGRRRGSVASTASRSIRDRAPTPPPPRSPTAKRFSHQSPPVPNLPANLGGPATAAGPLEKSTSNCDSLYDMYSGENRSLSTIPNDSDGPLSSETGAGVELIQLANGETIWNIVNGLRDDDDDYYNNRASFASEYSQPGTNEGGLQVFVKERGHGRSGSKGSTSSFLSRSKSGKRPETKVFYSPTANIGRLIEDLSQRMDAGSFNFMPTKPPHGHSPSSSMSTNELNYRLEERLDEMIHTVRSS